MQKYLFFLGKTPELSKLELRAVFPSVKWRDFTDELWEADFSESDLKIEGIEQAVIDKLGGVVKILRVIKDDLELHTKKEDLEQVMIDYFQDRFDRVKLAVSEIGRDHLPKIDVTAIKKTLEATGIPVRYIAGSRHGLEAAILIHKKGIDELYLVQNETELVLARTAATQNIDLWTLKDRGKPYADRKKGMLPPKLARMMLNLAIGEKVWNEREENEGLRVYDPFCGTGTVLMEALVSGMTVCGSDLDVKAVLGTEENLDWLAEKLELNGGARKGNFITKDAANVRLADIGGARVNYLVTEPFLGRQTPKESQLEGIYQGLERLYWGAFKNWQNLLANEAEIVLVLPIVQAEKKIYNFDSLIDKLKTLGYITTFEPVIYAREGAIVQRQITGLKYVKS